MKLRSFIATQDGNVLVHDHELERRRVVKPARVWSPWTAPHERTWVA